MKKFCALLLSLIFIFAFGACKTESDGLFDKVSDLRSDILEGESRNYRVKAHYGFKEQPFSADGKVGDKVYILKFRLYEKEKSDASYTLQFFFNEQKYSADFKLNPVSNALTAALEIENFKEKSLSLDILRAGEKESVEIFSIVPENVLPPETVLFAMYKSQPDIFNLYKDQNGDFNAEIFLRIIVKEQKPYYYVGIASAESGLKAFLADGYTAELLAVREIF